MSSGMLAGRVALITGAGQGSGRGCALALASEGAAIGLVGRTRSKLEAVAGEVAERGGRALVLPCDVTDPERVRATVDACVAELGGVNVLVNAAQSPIYRSARLLDIERDVMDDLWRSGPVATLDLMRACHPHLAGGGSIVNFGSGAQFGPGDYGVYAAVKAAIGMITRAAAEEWGPDGIRANLVVPFVASPAFEEDCGDTPEDYEAWSQGIPLRRIGDPEADLGRVVVFLAGSDSAYVTGTTLMVDGGMKFLR